MATNNPVTTGSAPTAPGIEDVRGDPGTGLWGWINVRFPAAKMLKEHVTEYYAPKNFNTW